MSSSFQVLKILLKKSVCLSIWLACLKIFWWKVRWFVILQFKYEFKFKVLKSLFFKNLQVPILSLYILKSSDKKKSIPFDNLIKPWSKLSKSAKSNFCQKELKNDWLDVFFVFEIQFYFETVSMEQKRFLYCGFLYGVSDFKLFFWFWNKAMEKHIIS